MDGPILIRQQGGNGVEDIGVNLAQSPAHIGENRVGETAQNMGIGGVLGPSAMFGDGVWVVKDLGGGDVTHYHFDRDGSLLAESTSAGVVKREYIHLDGLPLAVIDVGTSGTPTEIRRHV